MRREKMNKYIIIELIYGEEVQGDIHDIEIDTIAELCNDIKRSMAKLNVDVFFRETINERAVSDSFALVESNFELTCEKKSELVKQITLFFNDAVIQRNYLNVYNTLSAVRFLKVDGELIKVK